MPLQIELEILMLTWKTSEINFVLPGIKRKAVKSVILKINKLLLLIDWILFYKKFVMFCFLWFIDFPACISVKHKPAVSMEDRKSVGSCRTRVKDVVSYHVGAENWTGVIERTVSALHYWVLSLSLKYLLIIPGTQHQFYMTK